MAKYEHLGAYLKERRIEAGYSQAEIAKMFNYSSSQFVSNWERGICAPPGDDLQALIKIIKLDREILVERMLEDSHLDVMAKVYRKKSKKRSA